MEHRPESFRRTRPVVVYAIGVVGLLTCFAVPIAAQVNLTGASSLQALPTATGSGSQTGVAGFTGNFTAISTASGALALGRQPNCSLGFASGTYTITASGLTYTQTLITPHYEQVLHQEAQLTTTADVFAKGCVVNPPLGFGSAPGVFVGKTTTGVLVFAGLGITFPNLTNGIYLLTGTTTFSVSSFQDSPAGNITAADLNNDGNGDMIISDSAIASSAHVTIMLGKPDGTFQNGVQYPIAGDYSVAATVDDMTGDGIPDIVAVSGDQQITILPGKGDGTFGTGNSFAAPVLPGYTSAAQAPIMNLITADLRGNSRRDLVASNGLVLLNNGDGTFTAAALPAFPYVADRFSNNGPFLASGDVNNDGKADVIVSENESIFVWLGKGNGSFTQGPSYDGIASDGYLTVMDLDGDGNADIFVGLGEGGYLGGDEGNPNLAYALMGNGDGTFQGAPVAPGAYTGNNLADLDGDNIPDLVSANASGGLTVALNNGKGVFVTKSTVTAPSSFVINGYTFNGADKATPGSYAVGDVNGDGKADIVFVDNNLTAINPGSGSPISYPYPVYFVALGNGDGTFQAVAPYAFPQIAPPADFDNQLTVSALQIADFNKDGHADLIFVYNDVAGGSGVNPYQQGFVVLTGAGNGTFRTTGALTSTYDSGTAPATALTDQITNVQDLNGDGVPDLVVVVPSFSIATGAVTRLQVFVGNGDGTFKAPSTVGISANVYGVPVLADFNGDGKTDLAVLTEDSSSQAGFAIALGNGNGAFANATIANLSGGDAIRSGGLAAADFDGDGKVDLALFDSNDSSGIFYGQGDGTFASVQQTGYVTPKDLVYIAAGAPAVAIDLNNDGKPDILAGTVVLLNQATPSVTTPAATTTVLTASPITAAAGGSVTFTANVSPSSGSGTPTGKVTFQDGSTALSTKSLSSGTSAYSTSSLAVGRHSITAQYAGDTNFAASTSSVLSFTVTSAPSAVDTATTFTATPTSGVAGTSISLSATVTPASGSAVPSGSVSFLDGGTTLGTQSLNGSGVAALSTTSLATGTHSITAHYSGDTSFKASTSSAVTVTITAPVLDFSIAVSPASGTESSSSPATATVTVTPANGFNNTVSFTCSGLPAGLSCSFSPPTVTPAGAAVNTAMSISGTLTARSTSNRVHPAAPLALCGFGLGLLALARAGRHRRFFTALSVLVVALALAALSGCGSSTKKIHTQSCTVTIIATGGAISHSTTYALTISQ